MPVTFFFLGSIPVATSSVYLLWLLLAPVACAVWVLRARVVAAPVGVEVCNGLGVRRYAWADVDGFQVPRRGWVRLLTTGSRQPMTSLSRRDLPRLIEIGERAGVRDTRA